jgi:hypothetical protein
MKKLSPIITNKEEALIMRDLFNPKIAQSETDDLYNGTLIFRKSLPVKVDGTGIVKRGSPLTSEDGKTYTMSGENIIGILLYDLDCDDPDEAENGVLGITGEFNRNKIEAALGTDIDPEEIQKAWGKQIHIEANYKYPHGEAFPL